MDTGAFLALADSADPQHESAQMCIGRMVELRLPAIVTIPTVYESHRRLLHSLGASQARRFLDGVYDGTANIVSTTPNDEQDAIRPTGLVLQPWI